VATLREVRTRITSVQKTQKITRAMKMVAAAKLRRAQTRVVAARPYARKIKELLEHVLAVTEEITSDLATPREVRTIALVVVTSDRGFCGAFNSNLIRAAQDWVASPPAGEKVKLICLGKKGLDYFVKRKYTVSGRYVGVYGSLNFARAQAIADEIISGYRRGDFDRVDVIYNEFKSIAQQRIVREQFLPVTPTKEKPQPYRIAADYIYEPDRNEILRSLIPRHLNFQVWRTLLESSTAEEGARMAAMENATENASEMIATLELQYNKARQATITKELLEIVSGAEALTQAG